MYYQTFVFCILNICTRYLCYIGYDCWNKVLIIKFGNTCIFHSLDYILLDVKHGSDKDLYLLYKSLVLSTKLFSKIMWTIFSPYIWLHLISLFAIAIVINKITRRLKYYIFDWLIVIVFSATSNNISVYRGCQFYWWREPEYPEKTTTIRSQRWPLID
jgi:hypothetical protein